MHVSSSTLLLTTALMALTTPSAVYARAMDVDEWPSTEVRPALCALDLSCSPLYLNVLAVSFVLRATTRSCRWFCPKSS